MPFPQVTAWTNRIAAVWQRWSAANARRDQIPGQLNANARPAATIVPCLPSPFALLDASPSATLLLDHDLNVLHANEKAREAFGAMRVGAHIARSSRHPDLTLALTRVQDGDERALFEMQLRGAVERHLLGTVTRLASEGSPFDRGKDHATFFVVLQDISERDALARMRVEFVANASHELRTPLASLSGFIETLQGPAKDDPKARERFLAIMAEQAARMTRLIDDLLLLSRVEMRAYVLPTALVDLNAVVADAVKPLTRSAETSGKTLSIAPSPGPIHVLGEHDELIQAVQNLTQNALKYGKSQGAVTVRVSETIDAYSRTSWAAISVIDDGPGIAAEHLPRLTERFYRVNTAASREKGGTGLGLAIVKHIAARHRGKLEIASEVGKGSTFTIVLPAQST